MDELEKQRFELAQERLYDDLLEVLRRHDPLGVGPHLRPNEYMPETGTILARLQDVASADEMLHLVHEEFVRWRGEAAAGDVTRYEPIASDVWQARLRRLR
jgi:hypothetical protein